jgi:hypothetical protein
MEMSFEECREILLKESELVQNITGLQNGIHQAVTNRNWADLEDNFAALGKIKAEIAVLESRRERIFSEITGKTGDFSFYAYAAQLPAEQRAEVTEIYRSLKFETMRVRMSGEALMKYITEVRIVMAGFFEVAFPDRSGKIYTPHGISASRDMRSMVLNRSF